MRLNLIRSAAVAVTLGLLTTAVAGAVVRVNPVGPMTVVHPAPAGGLAGLQPQLLGRPIYPLQPDAGTTCPRRYYECVTLSPGGSYSFFWCVGYFTSTSSFCGPYGGTWTWSATANKGRKPTKILSVDNFSPNPGDPTTETVTVRNNAKSTDGKYLYYFSVTDTGTGSCGSICGTGGATVGVAIGSS